MECFSKCVIASVLAQLQSLSAISLSKKKAALAGAAFN